MRHPIDNTGAASGSITEHLTLDERALLSHPRAPGSAPILALCGEKLVNVQRACGNRPCKRCERIARAL